MQHKVVTTDVLDSTVLTYCSRFVFTIHIRDYSFDIGDRCARFDPDRKEVLHATLFNSP